MSRLQSEVTPLVAAGYPLIASSVAVLKTTKNIAVLLACVQVYTAAVSVGLGESGFGGREEELGHAGFEGGAGERERGVVVVEKEGGEEEDNDDDIASEKQ